MRGSGDNRRWRRGLAATVVVAAFVLTACAGPEQTAEGTLPHSEPVDAPDHTGPAGELAPSQITASTVAAPASPGPCALADLEFWTSQVFVGDRSADAVIRVRNAGDAWCEVDVSRSVLVDSAIEPSVWLDPGGWADLIVGQSGQGCLDPTIVTLADLDIHGDAVVVPTSAIASCGWRLTAFYPSDLVTQPCDQLDTVTIDGFVLLRNAGPTACELGELTAVDGHGAATATRTPTEAPSVTDLAAGDVVAIAFTVSDVVDCDGASAPGAMTFDVAGTIQVDTIHCGALYELGATRPWYSDPNGPLARFDPESFDLDLALAALDPFLRAT